MHNPVADGADGGFGAVLDFEFGEQGFEVGFDGVFAQEEGGADLAITPAFDEHLEDIHFALGEFGATVMVAGFIPGKTETLSLSIYHSVELGRDGEAAAFLAVSVALAFVAVWCSERLLRRVAA